MDIPHSGHQTVYANAFLKHDSKNINNMMLSGIYRVNIGYASIAISIKDILDLSEAGRLPKLDRNTIITLDRLLKPIMLATVRESMETSFINGLVASGFDTKYSNVVSNGPIKIDITLDDKDTAFLSELMETFQDVISDAYRITRDLSEGTFFFDNHFVLDGSSRVTDPEDKSIWYYNKFNDNLTPIEENEVNQIQESLIDIFNDGCEDTIALMVDIAATVSQEKLDNFHETMRDYRVTMSRQLGDLKMMIEEYSLEDANIKAYMEKHFDAFIFLHSRKDQ